MTKSEYLYGCAATEFNLPIQQQKLFLIERERRVEDVIRECLAVSFQDRDDERLRACLKAKKWIEQMFEELGGR